MELKNRFSKTSVAIGCIALGIGTWLTVCPRPHDIHWLIARTMEAIGQTDGKDRAQLYLSVARLQIESGDKEGAVKTLNAVWLRIASQKQNGYPSLLWAPVYVQFGNGMRECALEFVDAGDVETGKFIAIKLPSDDDQRNALVHIAMAQAEAGDIPGAVATLNLNTAAGTESWEFDAYRQLASGLGDRHHSSSSLYFARAMRTFIAGHPANSDFSRDSELNELAGVQVAVGDFAGALATASSMSAEDRRNACLNYISKSQAIEARDPGLVARLPDAGDRFDALLQIARTLIDSGADSNALRILNLAKAAADQVMALGRTDAFIEVAHLQVLAGDPASARQSMGVAVRLIPHFPHYYSPSALAEAQALLGDVDDAVKTAQAQNPDGAALALLNVTRVLANHHDWNQALAIAGMISLPATQFQARLYVAREMVRIENTRAALSLCQQMIEANALLTSPQERLQYDLAVAEIQSKAHDTTAAEQSIAMAHAEADRLDPEPSLGLRYGREGDPYYRGDGYAAVAQVQAECGDLDGAVRWIDRLVNPLDKVHAYFSACRGELERGQKMGPVR